MEPSQTDYEEAGGEEEDIVETEHDISFPRDIIELEHSFGYDCKRLFNMVLVDRDTLVFASGNYIHFFSISRREVIFRETVYGCGIGFITKNEHPDHQGLLTLGENGPRPTVFIYEYPSMNIRIKLLNAAKSCFTAGSYNSTGDLFASQAGYPDFIITIWRWEKAEVVLRAKSFQADILFVHFSEHNPILLVSSGLSHIKFWTMASTFTGLKLKGDLGRFGKTDFSDIYAAYMLGDENVISGCDWGNMLLWEAGLIKFEICRKGRKPCHTRPISRITMNNGEVTTVGLDGYVRVWFWETVDLADPPEDDLFVEIDPIYEFRIADVELRSMQKVKPFDPTDFRYYAQDGHGGIWCCDLNTYDIPKPTYQLYSCIGGKVIAAQMSPISPHMVIMSESGKLYVYNYEEKKLLLEKQFSAQGVDVLWFDTNISKFGTELVAGFKDGILRQLFLNMTKPHQPQMHIVQLFKAHTTEITSLSINNTSSLLLSGGADLSIFIYKLENNKTSKIVQLIPMGFVQLMAIPNCYFWMKNQPNTVIIGCKTGEVYEYKIRTNITEKDTFLTYNITEDKLMKKTRFVSVKSRIRREIKRQEIKQRKARKRERKMREVEKLKKANPGLQIDLESALADSEADEEEEPLHIPAVPNCILWLRYTDRDTIWVSMAGYDAGYIYELEFGAAEPSICTMIADADDIEIHSFKVIGEFLILGLKNGRLRIVRCNPDNFTDLTEYRNYAMHDAIKGTITRIMTSYNGEYLVSTGFDGNIFLYRWNGKKIAVAEHRHQFLELPEMKLPRDIIDPDIPTLEQEKINAELFRQQEAAEAHVRDVVEKIGVLQNEYFEIIRRNEELPQGLRVKDKDLLMDNRITQQIRDELQAELDDVREDCAYDLEFAQVGHQKLYKHFIKQLEHIPFSIGPIREEIMSVSTIRLQALGEEFEQIKRDIEERLASEKKLGSLHKERIPEQPEILHDLVAAEEKEDSISNPPAETFFFGRDPQTIEPKFSRKMMRLLTRYRNRQLYEVKRIFDWDKLERQKPDPNRNHPDDEAQIAEAMRNLGDYKLKIGADYEPKESDTLTSKYIEIVQIRERHFDLVNGFNRQVIESRARKAELIRRVEEQIERLRLLHFFIPMKNRRYIGAMKSVDKNLEFPEVNLIEHYQPGCGVNIDDILYLDKNVEEVLEEKRSKTRAESQQIENKSTALISLIYAADYVNYRALKAGTVKRILKPQELKSLLQTLPPLSELAYFENDKDNDTSPLLLEMRYRWLRQMLVEQDNIIKNVDEDIDSYDKELIKLSAKRFHTKLDAVFIQQFLISLNQELYILRDSESIETQLLGNANVAMSTRNELQVVINSTNRQLDEMRKAIDRSQEQIAALSLTFMSTIKGHKFFDFLRRIFKKKWRPPKIVRPEADYSSSSESSSSSSEEDETDLKSLDSMDMTNIRLDESTCPIGLERSLYELAFSMRADRHEIERAVLELNRDVDTKRRDIVAMQKQMKDHEETYEREKSTLMEFKRRRQGEINKVQISIILRMDQLQHFTEGDDYRDLSKAILFDADKLVELRRRVLTLNEEAQGTRRWHRVNIVHLRRMITDVKFMRYEITRLEEDIKQAMMKRFGMIINLDELEEEVLRRYVFELETTAEEDMKALDAEVRERQRVLMNCEEELVQEIQNNTEKRTMWMVMVEQSNFLNNILDVQERNYVKWTKPQVLNLSGDIEKLMGIEKQLNDQIESLEREICALRLKSKPLEINETHPAPQPPKVITTELLPNDEGICPAILTVDAYMLPPVPDDFLMDRVHTIVQKTFNRLLGKHTTPEHIRKWSQRGALYLCQAAYSFQGKFTERIADCITEHLETIVPKKYFIHISAVELRQLFNEIVAVFDYERSDVNTEELISGIFEHAKDTMCAQLSEVLNRTQFIVAHMFKELIEVLPLEEFQSPETLRILVDVLEREPMIDPRAIGVESLLDTTLQHAADNLLDGITAVPMRKLSSAIQKELFKRRQYKQPTCDSPLAVHINSKKPGGASGRHK